MNILNKYFLFLVTLPFFLLSSTCSKVKELEYIAMKNTKLEKIAIHSGKINLDLEYYNPNNFGVDIKETFMEVYIDDNYLGVAEQKVKLKVPKQSNFLFPITIQFDPMKSLGLFAKTYLTKKNSIKLRIKGTTRIGKKGVYIKVPFNVEDNVEL